MTDVQDSAEMNQQSARSEPVLLVEDDIGLQKQMTWALSPFEATAASSREEAVRLFREKGNFRIVVLDLGLPPDPDGAEEGLQTLVEILSINPMTKVIVASGN